MDWLSPHFTVEQLAAEDICVEEVRKHLAADAVLRGVFDGRIYAEDFMPADIGKIPALVVTPLTNDETPVPGARSAAFSLYVVARFPFPRRSRSLGRAGLPTLFRHIRTVLSAPGVRTLQVQVGPQSLPLVKRFEPATSITYAPVPVAPDQEAIFDAGQRFDLEATLDPVTRQLWNLAVNG